jgi:cytochrome c oxidase assembly protein subunit 15
MLPAGLARATASRVLPALRALPGLHTLPARALHIHSAHAASCSSRFTSALRAFREPAFSKPFAAPRRTISTTWPSLAKAIAKAKSEKPKAEPLPTLSPPAVGGWLLLSAGLVFTIIVVGGVTRLTESGLSITEWKPISGIMPPLNQQQWDEEFDKYKASPEYKMCVLQFVSTLALTPLCLA